MNQKDFENELQKLSKEEIKIRLKRLGIQFENEDKPKEYFVNLYKKTLNVRKSKNNNKIENDKNINMNKQIIFKNLLNNPSSNISKQEDNKDNINQRNKIKRTFNISKNYENPEIKFGFPTFQNDVNTPFKKDNRSIKVFKDNYNEKEVLEDSEGEIIDYLYNEGNYNNNLRQSGIKTISVIRLNNDVEKDNKNLLNNKKRCDEEKSQREVNNFEKNYDVKNSELNNESQNYNLINCTNNKLREYYNNSNKRFNNNYINNLSDSNFEVKNWRNNNVYNQSNNYDEKINYSIEKNNKNLNDYNENYQNNNIYNNNNVNYNNLNEMDILNNNNFNDFNQKKNNEWINNYNNRNDNYENQGWQFNQSNVQNPNNNEQLNFQNQNNYNQLNNQIDFNQLNVNNYYNNNRNNSINNNDNFPYDQNNQNEINTSNIMNLNSEDIKRKYNTDNKGNYNYMNNERKMLNESIRNKYHTTTDKYIIPPHRNNNNNNSFFPNPNIQLETSIQNAVINDIDYNSNNNFHSKTNMKRNYLKLSSVIVLLTITFFIISWYFLKNNGSVNNINIYITGIMFLLLLYQIIKYIQMVKFYHKIAEEDYKILKQRIHELKENNNIEQWIKMNDFIENSILRNNMFRNDYINNVLPRLRDLIKNDSFIKEQFYDDQIIWSEI